MCLGVVCRLWCVCCGEVVKCLRLSWQRPPHTTHTPRPAPLCSLPPPGFQGAAAGAGHQPAGGARVLGLCAPLHLLHPLRAPARGELAMPAACLLLCKRERPAACHRAACRLAACHLAAGLTVGIKPATLPCPPQERKLQAKLEADKAKAAGDGQAAGQAAAGSGASASPAGAGAGADPQQQQQQQDGEAASPGGSARQQAGSEDEEESSPFAAISATMGWDSFHWVIMLWIMLRCALRALGPRCAHAGGCALVAARPGAPCACSLLRRRRCRAWMLASSASPCPPCCPALPPLLPPPWAQQH